MAHSNSADPEQQGTSRKRTWNLGMLSADTDEVPGSVLLLSEEIKHNAPLGMDPDPQGDHRSSRTSLPSIFQQSEAMFGRHIHRTEEKKRTKDGKIILDPQPEESPNDPLNWSPLKRDAALLSLGFFCMLGGGMTPILAAGFSNVSASYGVSTAKVALTTGLYMMGLGVGSVIASPTAIAFGKRPVYLVASVIFMLTAVWCALSPNYASLCVARVIQGIAVSPVECLPSATIAEIFYLHERAYRLGIYTLLLLGGKNLIPLVSAAIIQSLGWRWVFWIVAIIVAFGGACLFFFVPESFWDRTPRPHQPHRKSTMSMPFKFPHPLSPSARRPSQLDSEGKIAAAELDSNTMQPRKVSISGGLAERREQRRAHFASLPDEEKANHQEGMPTIDSTLAPPHDSSSPRDRTAQVSQTPPHTTSDYFMSAALYPSSTDPSAAEPSHAAPLSPITSPLHYTKALRAAPRKTYIQSLTPYSGRLSHDNWFRVAARPFILFAYPAILWSSALRPLCGLAHHPERVRLYNLPLKCLRLPFLRHPNGPDLSVPLHRWNSRHSRRRQSQRHHRACPRTPQRWGLRARIPPRHGPPHRPRHHSRPLGIRLGRRRARRLDRADSLLRRHQLRLLSWQHHRYHVCGRQLSAVCWGESG